MVCPCKYPILLVKGGIEFFSLPLDVIEEMNEFVVPRIYEHTDSDGKNWMIVQWRENMHSGVKRYEGIGGDHIVYAGCEEKDISCNNKSLFEVWHPKDEWEKNHKFVM